MQPTHNRLSVGSNPTGSTVYIKCEYVLWASGEMANAVDLKSTSRERLRVRVPPGLQCIFANYYQTLLSLAGKAEDF